MDMLTWVDGTVVSMASTIPHITFAQTGIVLRNVKNANNWWYSKQVSQPELVKYYSAYMGGIDLL